MSDIQFMMIVAAVCAILIAVVGKMRGIRTAVIHSIVFVCYSGVLWYGLLYKGEGGTYLVWLFYLVIAYLLHFIVLMVTIAYSCHHNTSRIITAGLSILAFGFLATLIALFCG